MRARSPALAFRVCEDLGGREATDAGAHEAAYGVDHVAKVAVAAGMSFFLSNESINVVPHVLVINSIVILQERRGAGVREPLSLNVGTPPTVTPLDDPPSVPVPRAVIDALRNIHTIRYENSFAARVYGHKPPKTPGLIAVDWESRPPWMLLMEDVHAHYGLAQSVYFCARAFESLC